MIEPREWTVTRITTYTVDVDALLTEFAADMEADEVDTGDSAEVVAAAWDNGVRDPYFIPTIFDHEETDLSA